MGKRRHEEVQTTSSNVALIAMGAAGIAVAALVIWALTRTVQTSPATSADVPAVAETAPATNTLPPLDTGGFSTTPANVPPVQTSTYTPNPPTSDENASVKRMSVTDLRSKIDTKQVTVIDVRDKTSFIASHIPGSLHVPMATVESQVTFLPKDKPIVTYCTWPNEESSARAALILQKYGFTNVSALEGGYDAWRTVGAPTAQGDPPPIP